MPASASPPASAPARRRRAWRWAAGTLGALFALLVLGIVVLAYWDWNQAKPWVERKVSEATGRSFAIGGDLSAEWHWPQPLESGWQRWVPGVTVRAQQLSMGNPEGMEVAEAPAKASDGLPLLPAPPRPSADGAQRADADASAPPRDARTMGTIANASATLRLLPLLSRTLMLDTVVLEAPDIVLARKDDGGNNWTFRRPDVPAEDRTPWRLRVDQLVVREGWVGYVDGVKNLALRARIDTLAPGDPEAAQGRYGVRVALQGRYGKAAIEGHGVAGPVLTLRERTVNYPLRLQARTGSVQAQAEGVLANPAALSGMDLQVMLKGASMADLYELTGLVLPNTPPFQTRGRLIGSLAPGKAVWEYRDFDGTVGNSDLHGSLTYTSAKPRPKLQGHMVSKQLRLADRGRVRGAPRGKRPQEKGTDKRPGKVLPDAAFATDRWNAMDLDLAFSGQKIIRPESLPLENLSVRAVLDGGRLRLTPLRFGVAHGRIDSEVELDGRAKPLKATLQGSVNGLRLSALFPKVELMEKSLGRLDGGLALAGTGNSVAKLLGSSSGQARVYIRDGTFSKQMLDLAALNLGSVVVAKLFGENKEVQLRCAVADLAVQDGVARTRNVKLNTDEAIVEATGQIDLESEGLDLRIKPESLKWKFFSLRTPLYVRGTFADPQVGVEPGPLLLRAGAAVAAAVVAPAALALVPVTVPAAEDDANCATLLAGSPPATPAGKGKSPRK
jgi:uncharacterized protein involved in outer membrane biogenesis